MIWRNRFSYRDFRIAAVSVCIGASTLSCRNDDQRSALNATGGTMSNLLYGVRGAAGRIDAPPMDFWETYGPKIKGSAPENWSRIEKSMYLLKPIAGSIKGTVHQKDVVLLAIAKLTSTPWAPSPRQPFQTLWWGSNSRTFLAESRTIAEIDTFTGVNELKAQGAYPVPDRRRLWTGCIVLAVLSLLIVSKVAKAGRKRRNQATGSFPRAPEK